MQKVFKKDTRFTAETVKTYLVNLIIWNTRLFAVTVETDTGFRLEKLDKSCKTREVLYRFSRKTKDIEAFSDVK